MTGKEKTDLNKIKMLVLDVDGVLTDGTILINQDGTESKRFDLHDGHGIKLWHRAGGVTALISGRENNATTVRAEQLSIAHVFQNCKKKLPVYESLLAETGLSADQTAYVGDDVLDIPIVRRVALGVAVANAVDELKDAADMITQRSGGRGAVREVIEYILKNTNKWTELMQRYTV